ncbi:MAG: DUF4118 domain-containing protein [Zoogloea sp.]|uniref:DUF4118 domain-containing protein n=1 Tax=Zoogloea sp. TaxID=49181 RepID=UPI00260D085B|nr:DUF4118 domain-containing protein [Zoogloea sp.]MDD2989133.1 DUF4118 domain-containing protein [Zoogloea sp.]
MPLSILLTEGRNCAHGRRYGLAVLACGVVALGLLPFRTHLDLPNTVMFFLLSVVIVAVTVGRGPAVLTSVLGVALFDFLFVPPRFSFEVSYAPHLLTFVVMLVVSLLVGQLTAGLRLMASEAARRERVAQGLYGLARELAGAVAVEQVDESVARFLQDQWQAPCRLLLPAPDERLLAVRERSGPFLETASVLLTQARSGLRPLRVPAGDGSGRHVHALPLAGATRNRGVLMVALEEGDEDIGPLLEALAALVSTAVERLHFVEVAQAAQVEAVSERLRSSILSALSHDVRTPLTALYGLADSLVVGSPPLPDEARDIAGAIRDQALRVNGMVGNLLDMARLQSGPVHLRKEWQPVEEVVGASLQLLGKALDGHPLRVSGLAELPLLDLDAVLIERVFCNLLENATKYSPPGAPIVLSATTGASTVELQVASGGSGFPPDKLDRVFELFERGQPETAEPGMGIGLAICRAIIEAHGGSIRAFNPPEGGGCVAFCLPLGNPPPIESEALVLEGEGA